MFELDINHHMNSVSLKYSIEVIMKLLLVVISAVLITPICYASEPTKASQSSYNHDMKKASTSKKLTNADLAWHAQNTYGWDCSEVVSRSKPKAGGFYTIKCSSGTELRVYPRNKQHPKITNIKGAYN